MKTRRLFETCGQECFSGFALVLSIRVLKCGKPEIFELCSDRDSVAQSWKNGSKIVGESGKRSVVVLGETAMIPRCFLQLALDTEPYTPSTEQRSDECLKYSVGPKIVPERQE